MSVNRWWSIVGRAGATGERSAAAVFLPLAALFRFSDGATGFDRFGGFTGRDRIGRSIFAFGAACHWIDSRMSPGRYGAQRRPAVKENGHAATLAASS
jgi:hypothetical protein